MNDILKGELVRLSALDPDEFGKAFSRWDRDSEFMRLLDSSPSQLQSQKGMQKSLEDALLEELGDQIDDAKGAAPETPPGSAEKDSPGVSVGGFVTAATDRLKNTVTGKD